MTHPSTPASTATRQPTTTESSAGRSSPGSSRRSSAGAGWKCGATGSFKDLITAEEELTGGATKLSKSLHDRMYWLRLNVLWGTRNDILAKLSDPVPDLRRRWIGGRGVEDLRVDLTELNEFSFLVMGDTGEGDWSQYAVVPPLRNVAEQCHARFVVICSDVIYPVGNVNEYGDKFYRPYQTLPIPIYALPGNHDWYDNLSAFMANFGEPTVLPPVAAVAPVAGGALNQFWHKLCGRIRNTLWRPAPVAVDAVKIQQDRELRGSTAQLQPHPQPGPYYVIDTGPLRLVCIDTGIRGDIDDEQGRWLHSVSADRRPKILLTGKPLLVDGEVHPCPIQGAHGRHDTVLSVVHDPAFRYVAVIGGDIHNYQHYPATVDEGGTVRTIHHIVSGGGGAFMHATHLVPAIDPDTMFEVTEKTYTAYPLRRDSLAAYSHVVQAMIDKVLPAPLRPKIELNDQEAAQILNLRLGFPLERPAQQQPAQPVPVSRAQLWASRLLLQVGGKRFHSVFSPFCDWDDPPFFKHFLRLDVHAAGVTIRCHGVTGCAEDEAEPSVEEIIDIQWPDSDPVQRSDKVRPTHRTSADPSSRP